MSRIVVLLAKPARSGAPTGKNVLLLKDSKSPPCRQERDKGGAPGARRMGHPEPASDFNKASCREAANREAPQAADNYFSFRGLAQGVGRSHFSQNHGRSGARWGLNLFSERQRPHPVSAQKRGDKGGAPGPRSRTRVPDSQEQWSLCVIAGTAAYA